ncbi:hypothetical protein PG911_07105 [Tenacibaculum ovolyticum]|uniref:hypothetical protein n=2 Tax=Tenacibaculum ovolyticum TaxID=104270 RepID=UPI0007EE19DD|nr:hypothetical protein [Tenacibaculum ovolyticum]WBX78016.1 hypothetical protein PG911_07105 [Tenacibaculum ovolyticum]
MNRKKEILTTVFLLSAVILFSQDSEKLSKKETNSLINTICLKLKNTYFDSTKANELCKVLNQKLKKKFFYNI